MLGDSVPHIGAHGDFGTAAQLNRHLATSQAYITKPSAVDEGPGKQVVTFSKQPQIQVHERTI